MCGIAGFWSEEIDNFEPTIILKKMMNALEHRGPDNFGFWNDAKESLYLSQSRLAILDLSSAGNQPMLSKSGRYVISFNGEIYNHYDLKKELEKSKSSIKWIGHSDTEILLALIDEYGLKKTLNKCIGMFAIALWDKKEKVLKLARDRMGEKPLYYGFSGENNKAFVFGSELSAIKKWKYFNNKIRPQALFELVNYQNILAPNSIYENIFQLKPGNIITINSPKKEFLQPSEEWWSLTSTIKNSLQYPISDELEAKNCIEKELQRAIQIQSIADVPIGTFLSGGIDSTLITAILQSQKSKRVKTFTVGFEENKFNEAPFAKQIAKYLDTEHTEIFLTSKDAQDMIPKISEIYSEPFADSSQLPTYLVCREAKKNGLKVTLSGDGGDEIFGGYGRYFLGKNIWKKLEIMPFEFRKIIGGFVSLIQSDYLNRFSKIDNFNKVVNKLSNKLINTKNGDQFYHSIISQWDNTNNLFNNNFNSEISYSYPSTMNVEVPDEISNDIVARMMIFDSLNFLPNDILTKVDRASMANSLEIRAPFLDLGVIENAWKVDMNLKVKSNGLKNYGKLILRKILYDYVPKELVERPKLGFAIPLSDWLRGPLKIWTGDLLSEELIQKYGFFNVQTINKLWHEHLSGEKDNSTKLWPIIIFQSWLTANKL